MGLLFRENKKLEICSYFIRQRPFCQASEKRKQAQVGDGKHSIKEHIASQIETLSECHSGLCRSEPSYAIWENDTYTAGKIYSNIKLFTSLMAVSMNLTAKSSFDQWPRGVNRIHFHQACREQQSWGQIFWKDSEIQQGQMLRPVPGKEEPWQWDRLGTESLGTDLWKEPGHPDGGQAVCQLVPWQWRRPAASWAFWTRSRMYENL